MGLASNLLGRHIRPGTRPFILVTALDRIMQREPKIRDVGLAELVHKNVGRFDISMHETVTVSVMQGFGDIGDKFSNTLMRKLLGFPYSVERLSLNVFHDDEAAVAGRATPIENR